MPRLVVINRAAEEIKVQAQTGISVMQNIRNAGIDEILALCGGSCACATCHVYVDDAWFGKLAPADGSETDLLEYSNHHQPNSRLSCQIPMSDELDGLKVTIAPEE